MGTIALVGGCAPVRSAARVRELTQKVSELSEKHTEALARQEELETRLLMLSDQLESQRVAEVRRGSATLPVVSLRPELAPVTAPAAVEFAGEARSENPERIRPVLRAEGAFAATLPGALESPPPAARAEGRRLPLLPAGRRRQPVMMPPATPLDAGGDNLGVVPVPRLSAAATPPAMAPAAPPAAPPAPHPAIAAADIRGVGARRAAAPAVGAEPLLLYRTAYDHLRGGRLSEAERDLREFVRRFPRHDYADNAQYWLGETFYARKTYPEAASSFRAVVERWPAGNKAPDALLKLGFTLILMGDAHKGRAVLGQLIQHYPNTEAVRLAQRRLVELKESK